MKRSGFPLLALGAGCLVLLAGCEPLGKLGPQHFSIYSVKAPASAALSLSRAFVTHEALPLHAGDEDAGAPEYMVITLKRILLEGTFDGGGTAANVWETVEGVPIKLSGNGEIDLTGVEDLGNLPVGTVDHVKVTFGNLVTVKGSFDVRLAGPNYLSTVLTASPDVLTGTVHTKAAYGYDTNLHQGGSADWNDFTTGESEETTVAFTGDVNSVATDREYEFPVSATLTAGDSRPFTLMFDLSRALRFYDGLGTNAASPADLTNKAYFYSHTILEQSIVCFFGTPGKVEGYSTLGYNATSSASNLVPGWMTLVYNASDGLQTGVLTGYLQGTVISSVVSGVDAGGNDVLTLSERAGLDADYTTYELGGFTRLATLGSRVDGTWLRDRFIGGVSQGQESGDVRFTLGFTLP